jgi:hypothetical protein
VDSGKSKWIPVNLVDFGKSCDPDFPTIKL